MQIEANISDVIRFLKYFKKHRSDILYKMVSVLENTLYNRVFNYETGNVHIGTKEDLKRLVSAAKGSSSHRPGNAPPGKAYNQEYLRRKAKLGETKPHKYMNYSFWQGTYFRVGYWRGTITMEAEMSESCDKDFDYLSHHERNRSVLKLTFLMSWEDIMKVFIKEMAKGLKGK